MKKVVVKGVGLDAPISSVMTADLICIDLS